MEELIILECLCSEFLESSSSSDDDFLFSDEEDFEEDRVSLKNLHYFQAVERFNDLEFIKHFRVSRQVAYDLTAKYEASPDFNQQSGGYGKITAYNQVLIFLWFAGHQTASFRDVAKRFCIAISSLFRIVRRLTYVISSMADTEITWPNEQEKQQIKNFFKEKGFPNVIGVVGGSHIRIDKPSSDPDSYYNKGNFFSIQMQAVCDHKKKIRSIHTGFPGSVESAQAFRGSPLALDLVTLCREDVILGDSAYPCLRNLITPFRGNGRLSPQQKKFNRILSSCRCVVKDCFDMLKLKFRQLNHCKLRKVEDLVHFLRACCVLHNLSIDDIFRTMDESKVASVESMQCLSHDQPVEDAPEGTTFRNSLLCTMFP